MILRRGDIYATASIAGATTYLLMKPLGVGAEMAAVIGVTVVMVLRLAAILYGIKLPTIAPPLTPALRPISFSTSGWNWRRRSCG